MDKMIIVTGAFLFTLVATLLLVAPFLSVVAGGAKVYDTDKTICTPQSDGTFLCGEHPFHIMSTLEQLFWCILFLLSAIMFAINARLFYRNVVKPEAS